MLLNAGLGPSLASGFSFAFTLYARLFIALTSLDFGKNAGFLDFFLESLQSGFDTFAFRYSNFGQRNPLLRVIRYV
jgi:hypothetical protein